jgi:hypothetical protein
MVMLYEGGLKNLTTTRYPVYPVMSYSVSRMGYIVGYVVMCPNNTFAPKCPEDATGFMTQCCPQDKMVPRTLPKCLQEGLRINVSSGH